jgi:hypothetical protein
MVDAAERRLSAYDDLLFSSLHPDKAIDMTAVPAQTGAIHRDRLRDRPEEAGAT